MEGTERDRERKLNGEWSSVLKIGGNREIFEHADSRFMNRMIELEILPPWILKDY